jgi:hypothetical protein
MRFESHNAPLRIKACGRCGEPGEYRRQSSAYNNEESNWLYACDPCFEDLEEMWADMWREYYAGLMC